MISGGRRMKCTRCRERARSSRCRGPTPASARDCFTGSYVPNLVTRAIRHDHMFGHRDRVLVACRAARTRSRSGTCCSTSATTSTGSTWASASAGTASARTSCAPSSREARGRRLVAVDLAERAGYTIPQAAATKRRPACASCGTSKRHLFNAVAREEGYDVLATGHNLDDEVAVLLGNVLRWETDYLARQSPVLRVDASVAGEEGEAALPRDGARDRGVLRPAGDRLRRRGVPARRGQHADEVQGDARRARGAVARGEAQLPLRLPREGAGALPARRRRAATRAPSAGPRPRARSARSARAGGCSASRR